MMKCQQVNNSRSLSFRNNYHNSGYVTYHEKPTFKKVAVATASGILPGLGQAFNGQWGKGAIFFGGGLGLACLQANCISKGAKLPAVLFALGLAAVRACSVVDSYIHSR